MTEPFFKAQLPMPPSVNGYWLVKPKGKYLSAKARKFRSEVIAYVASLGRIRTHTGRIRAQERCVQKNSERNISQNQSERNKWQSGVNKDAGFHDTDHRCQRGQGVEPQAIYRQRPLQRREDIGGLTDLLSRPDVPAPLFWGMDDELPHWRKRLKAIGNGQDPIVMATAYKILSGEFV